MAKRILILLIIALTFSVTNAEMKVITSTNHTLKFEFINELQSIEEINIDNNTYLLPTFKDAYNYVETPGTPQSFVIKRKVIVPSPSGFELASVKLGRINSISGKMAPVSKIQLIDAMPYEESIIKTDSYTGGRKGDIRVELNYAGISRGNHVAELSIFIAEFNPMINSIQYLEDAEITIKYIENGSDNSLTPNKEERKYFFDDVFLNSKYAGYWGVNENLSFQSENYQDKSSKKSRIQENDNISSGNWFKLGINKTGIYRLDAAYLSGNGINISPSDVSTIKIFGKGGKELNQQIIGSENNAIIEQDIIVNTNSDGSVREIIFFGAAASGFEHTYNSASKKNDYSHYVNKYSKNNHYLLTWGGRDGKRAIENALPNGEVNHQPSSYIHRIFEDEELLNAFALGSGKKFFGRNYFTESFDNTLHNLDKSGEILYKISLAHKNSPNSSFKVFDGSLVIDNNLFVAGTSSGTYTEAVRAYKEYKILSSDITSDKSSLKFSYHTSSGSQTAAYFDYYEIHYPRPFIAINNALNFFTDHSLEGNVRLSISGFNNKPIGFDITNIESPRLVKNIATSNSTFETIYEAEINHSKQFMVSSAFLTPTTINKANYSSIRGKKLNADVIVITHSELMESALKYKSYREKTHNYKVEVFSTEEIYNEFNAGSMDITAIRNFVSYAYHNWESKPKYVVLWGDGHYDYRNINTDKKNFVPPHQTDDDGIVLDYVKTSSEEDFYVTVDGEDLIPDIPIGRISINDNRTGNWLVEKIEHYETNSSKDSWRISMGLVADDGLTSGTRSDGATFVNQSENLSRNHTPDYMLRNKLYPVEHTTQFLAIGRRKPTAEAELLRMVNNEGVVILNFLGHGNPTVWTHESIYNKDLTTPKMTNMDKLFFLSAATCDFGRFDLSDYESGAEELFNSTFGGAIGVFSSTRPVFTTDNAAINYHFFSRLFEINDISGDYNTIGDVMYSVKQGYNRQNDRKFFILADPLLRLNLPKYSVAINEINQNSTNNIEDAIIIQGLEEVVIKGEIRDNFGNSLNDFNGVVRVMMLDGDIDLRVTDERNDIFTFSKFGGALSNASYVVTNGKFEAKFIIPKDISFSDNNGRLFIYATEDNFKRYAKGYNRDFLIDGIAPNAADDTKGPKIDIFIDSRRFKRGDVVRNNPLLIVDLYDESGINSTGTGIGRRIEAWIDDNPLSIDLTPNYETSLEDFRFGTTNRFLVDLKPGFHSVKVRAWDIYNNFSIAESYFNLVPEIQDIVVEKVQSVPNPFWDQTTISFRHNLNPPFKADLEIFDPTGTRVKQLSSSIVSAFQGEFIWDGKDDFGASLSQGTYIFRITLIGSDNQATILKGNVIKIR